MKLLCSSTDLRELTWLVKRLVRVRIPCAVCKDSGNSHLSVWIQQDVDFPLAFRIFVNRERPRSVPHWAHLLESPAPVVEKRRPPATGKRSLPVSEDRTLTATDGLDTARLMLVESRGATRTATA